MRNFLLLVNILALTLPFLAAQMQSQDPAKFPEAYWQQHEKEESRGQCSVVPSGQESFKGQGSAPSIIKLKQRQVAEVQNQEQLACREKNEQVFDQTRALPTPIHYVLSSKAHYDPSYYQYRPAVAVSPYVPYQYFLRLLVLRPPVQLSKWQVLPNIPQIAGVPHPNPRPSFLAIPTNGNQDESAIPATHAAASVEPTPVPAIEPAASTVANPEVSTLAITVASTATEPATVPVSSPVGEKH